MRISREIEPLKLPRGYEFIDLRPVQTFPWINGLQRLPAEFVERVAVIRTDLELCSDRCDLGRSHF